MRQNIIDCMMRREQKTAEEDTNIRRYFFSEDTSKTLSVYTEISLISAISSSAL